LAGFAGDALGDFLFLFFAEVGDAFAFFFFADAAVSCWAAFGLDFALDASGVSLGFDFGFGDGLGDFFFLGVVFGFGVGVSSGADVSCKNATR